MGWKDGSTLLEEPPQAQGPSWLAGSTLLGKPAPEQPAPAAPAKTELEFEGKVYSFSPEYDTDSALRWLNTNVMPSRRKLSREDAAGRSQYYDSEQEQKLRRSTPISQQGLKEWADFLSGEDAEGKPIVVKPEEVTPQVMAEIVKSYRQQAEEAAKTPGVNPVKLREVNEDIAAMERELERRWPNETIAENVKRRLVDKMTDAEAIEGAKRRGAQAGISANKARQMIIEERVKGRTPEQVAADEAILNSRPGYVARKNQPKEAFWAENLLREYQQEYGDEIPRDKKPAFDNANKAYDAWLKNNPAGAEEEFDGWRRSAKVRSILHPEEQKQLEEQKRNPNGQRYYNNLSEAMVAYHAYKTGNLDVVPYWLKRLPFAGTAVEAADLVLLRNAVKNIDANKATDSDWFTLAGAIDAAEKSKDRGFGRKVFDLVSQLPAMGVEFTMTGGGFTAARVGARRLAVQVLGKQLMRRAIPRLAVKAAGFAAGVAGRTALNAPLVAAKVAEKWMPEYNLTRDESDQLTVSITGDDPSFLEALGKGFGAAYIEMGSEEAGRILGVGGKALAQSKAGQALAQMPLAQRTMALRGALLNRFLANGGTAAKANEILRKAGWNGMIGEVFEERVADVAGGVTGIEKDYSTTGKLLTNDPEGWEQLAVEAVSFAAIPAGQTALSAADAAMAPADTRGPAQQLEPVPLAAQTELEKLREVVAKGWVTLEEAKDAGLSSEEMTNRGSRKAAVKARIQQLEQEIQDAAAVRENQGVPEEAGQVGEGVEADRIGDVYRPGQEQVSPEPTGEVAETRVAETPDRAELERMTDEDLQQIWIASHPNAEVLMPLDKAALIRDIMEVWGAGKEQAAPPAQPTSAADLTSFAEELAQEGQNAELVADQPGAVAPTVGSPAGSVVEEPREVERQPEPAAPVPAAVPEPEDVAGEPEGREGVKSLSEIAAENVDELGNWRMAGDTLRKELAKRDTPEVIDFLKWAYQQSPHVKRNAGTEAAMALRERGVPVDEIRWQQETLPPAPQPPAPAEPTPEPTPAVATQPEKPQAVTEAPKPAKPKKKRLGRKAEPAASTTAKDITETWLKSKGEDRGFYEQRQTLVNRFRQLAGRLLKNPWSTQEKLTVKNRQGQKDRETAGRGLGDMRDLGLAQVAWDKSGNAYWAAAGEAIPDHLMDEETADKYFAEHKAQGIARTDTLEKPEPAAEPPAAEPASAPEEGKGDKAETGAAGWDAVPEDGVRGFEANVLDPLRSQVRHLDDIKAQMGGGENGSRYAWEAATQHGEKPGDPHDGTPGLERWSKVAAEQGLSPDSLLATHVEYNDLRQRLDAYRGWGDETAVGSRPNTPLAESKEQDDARVRVHEEGQKTDGNDLPKVEEFGTPGAKGNLILVNGETPPVQYYAAEADYIIPSHDARRNYRPNERGDKNERDYQDSKQGRESRMTVEKIAAANPIKLPMIVSDTPTPTDGPPMATIYGVVLGGNARAMGVQLGYSRGGETAARIKQTMVDAAPKFGIEQAAVAAMKHPIIIRVLENAGEPGELSAILNEALTTGRTMATQAASVAARLSDSTVSKLAAYLQPDSAGDSPSVRDVLSSPSRAKEIVMAFQRDGAWTQRDVDMYVDPQSETLNDAGKLAIEQALLGLVLKDTSTIGNAPKGVTKHVFASLGPMVTLSGHATHGARFAEIVRAIADSYAGYKGSDLPVEQYYLEQGSLFGLPGKGDRSVATLAKAMDEMGVRKFKETLTRVAKAVGIDTGDRQSTLFETQRPAGTVDEAIANEFLTSPSPLSRASAAADKEVGEAFDKFKKSLRSRGAGSNLFLDPEILAAATNLTAKLVKAGVLRFAVAMERMTARFGKDRAEQYRPYMERAWDDTVAAHPEWGMEPRVPAEPEAAPPAEPPRVEQKVAEPAVSSDDLTSIKKAVVNDLRDMVGLPEMEGSTPQTVLEWAEQAETTLRSDPNAAIRLVNELANNPRPISQHDAMLLQFRYRQLANELKPFVDEYFAAVASKDFNAKVAARTALMNARYRMTEFEEIIHPSKETWGRAGVALQQMLRKDFSLEAVLRRGQEANNGEELSPEQVAELTKLAKQFEDLQKRFDEQSRKVEELERELASKAQHEEAVKKSKQNKGRSKSQEQQDAATRRKAAWENFKDKWAALGHVGFVYDPKAEAKKQAELLAAAVELAKSYAAEGFVRFREFWTTIKGNIGKDAAQAEAVFHEAWDQVAAEAGIAVPELDMDDLKGLSKDARRIQRLLVELGMTDRDQVIDTVHEIMSEDLPDLTRRAVMDALSQYGQFQTQSQNEIDKLIRDMNAEILKLSQADQLEIALKRVEELRAQGLSDEEIGDRLAQENLLVKATGLVRDRPTETVRQLTKQYNELKKQIPSTSEGRAGHLQTAQDAIVRALGNRIRDVRWELEHQERIVRDRHATPDTDLIRALRAELDELMKIHREMFPPQRKQMTPEQKLAAAERAATRLLEFMQKQEAAGFPPAPVTPKPLTSAQLEATRKQIAEIRQRRDVAQREGKRLEQLDQQIAKLEERLKTGDIAPKVQPTPYTTPMIEARIARRKQLQKELEARQKAEMPELAEQRARKAYEANLLRRIADYQQILADGDFAPKPKKEARQLSASELKLKREMEDIRHQVMQKYAEYHLAHLHGIAWTADKIMETAHLSRALMTSFDLSALLRQGGLPAMGRPILAKRALFETVASIAGTFDSDNARALKGGLTLENIQRFLTTIDSRQAEFNFMHQITSGADGEFRLRAGLNLPSTDEAITKQEEVFQGRWGKVVPGIALSSRLYTMILNKIRSDLFDTLVENLGRNGKVTMDEAKLIASFVNVATGRSDFKQFNKWAAVLNAAFFAPRYVASRFQYLAMPFYLPFKGGLKSNWRVKRAIYKEYGRTAVGIGTVLGSLALAGMLFWDDDDDDKPTVEVDPRSSDFLKVRMGDTRLDFLAGLSQTVVLSTRLLLPEALGGNRTKSSVTGEVTKFGETPMSQTKADVVTRFLRSKLAPIPSTISTVWFYDWENVVGQKETPLSLAANLLLPLSLQDISKTMETQGIPKTAAMSLLSILGVGMSTYGPKTEYVTGTPEERAKQFKKDLKNLEWDSKPPAYSEFLRPEQMQQVADRLQEEQQTVVSEGLEPEPKRTRKDDDESYQKKLDTHEKARRRFQEMVQARNIDHARAQQLLVESYRKLDDKGKPQTELNAKNSRAFDESYWAKAVALAKLYGHAEPQSAVADFRGSQEFQAWNADWWKRMRER